MTEITQNGVFPPGSLAKTYLYYPGTTNGRDIREDIAPYAEAMATAFLLKFGKPLYATDGARDLATQIQLKKDKPFLAAPPGTSNHGWARAFDLSSGVATRGSAEHKWILANEGKYGFEAPDWANNPRNPLYKNEPWHHEFVGGGTKAGRIQRPTKGEVGLGDTGSKVERIQVLLNQRLPGENLKPDGGFGLLTAAQVIKFQKSVGLNSTGTVGPVTMARLEGKEPAKPSKPETPAIYFQKGTKKVEQVKTLQRFLRKFGYNGRIDGEYGEGTEAAVKRWQSKAGFTPTGKIGEQSIRRLRELEVF